ncbi:putative transcription factor capicua isoform X1 [Phthorimaea operculella]|nr:putative transcription factor capicua isoform X1 [Phthorimaea operculella]
METDGGGYDQIPASVISSVGTVSLSQSSTSQTPSVMANPMTPGAPGGSGAPGASAAPTATATQQTTTQAPVRNLPKKRKFDPSELEEIERNCTNNNNTTSNVPTSVPMSVEYQPSNYHPQQVLHRSPIVHMSPPAEIKPYPMHYPNIDLSEWRDHRVLAKQRGLYLPGVIRQADGCKVVVEFDWQENEPVEYNDIFGENKYDIISDASPQMSHLLIGSACVVRTTDPSREGMQNVFVEGLVFEVLNSPIRIRVKQVTDGDLGKETVEVKRADLRLLQPPWADELEDAGSQAASSHHNPHLRMHPVPMQHGRYLHDYVTYFFLSCRWLSNGSMDELRKRTFDDYGESDDELKNDIMFPIEVSHLGKFI